jgi:carbon starvation protein
MGKAKYIWVTALPMAFVGIVTLTASYRLFFLYLAQAGQAADASQVFSFRLDAILVGIVAALAVLILTDSAIKWYGYLVQKKPYTTTEVVAEEFSEVPPRPV